MMGAQWVDPKAGPMVAQTAAKMADQMEQTTAALSAAHWVNRRVGGWAGPRAAWRVDCWGCLRVGSSGEQMADRWAGRRAARMADVRVAQRAA